MYSVIVRLSKPTDAIINTTVHLYGGYSGPSYANVTNFEPHRSIKYIIKLIYLFHLMVKKRLFLPQLQVLLISILEI